MNWHNNRIVTSSVNINENEVFFSGGSKHLTNTLSRDKQPSPRHRNSSYLSLPKKPLEKTRSSSDSHTHKIMLSVKSPCPSIRSQKLEDESKVSVKVYSTDSFDNLLIAKDVKRIDHDKRRVDKPNLKSHDRSKSCLVYIPTDPWVPNIDIDQANYNNNNPKSSKTKKKGENRMKKLMNTKSLSRPDLDDVFNDDDPWVYDETIKIEKKSATFTKRSTRSFHIETGKSGTMQPSHKSPNEINKNFPSTTLSFSTQQKDPMLSLSPTLGYRTVDENKVTNMKQRTTSKSQHLNVSNPNLLQPRHSFSSSSRNDDELPLNIRRLSEEIKCSSNYSIDRNYSSTASINQYTKSSEITTTISSTTDKGAPVIFGDSLLETTC